MNNSSRTLVLAGAIACLLQAGCASHKLIASAPQQSQPVTVEFTEGQLLGWTEVPASAYFVPDSQMIITGQLGQVGNVPDTGRPAWLVALAAASAVMGGGGGGGGPGGAGKIDLHGLEDAVRINLTARATEQTKRLLATERYASYFAASAAPAPSLLSAFTSVILTYVNDSDAVLFVIIKASLTDSSAGRVAWGTRYFASSGTPRPVVGEGSWAEMGSAGIERALAPYLARAIEFMLADVSRPRARDDENLYTVQSRFPYLRQCMRVVGYKLHEDEQSIYFAPRIHDSMAFSGIHVLDKSVTEFRKAADGDVGIAGLKMLECEMPETANAPESTPN